MTKIEVMEKINELLDQKCDDPAAELIRLGEVMVEIGKTLEGQPIPDARRILKSVAIMQGCDREE